MTPGVGVPQPGTSSRRGVPPFFPIGRYPHPSWWGGGGSPILPDREYPIPRSGWGVPDLGWGNPPPHSDLGWGYPPPILTWDGTWDLTWMGRGTPSGTAQRVLITRRLVCLLRSRRRTFWLPMILMQRNLLVVKNSL